MYKILYNKHLRLDQGISHLVEDRIGVAEVNGGYAEGVDDEDVGQIADESSAR